MQTIIIAATATLFAVPALAGVVVPLPGSGIIGPVALAGACAAIAGIKFLRNRRSK